MQDTNTWLATQLAEIETKAQSFTSAERDKYNIDYLKNAIQIVPTKITVATELEQFKTTIEALLLLPISRNEKGKLEGKAFFKSINELKISVQKQYNLVSKGYYVAIYLPLGVAIGLPFGLMFKNLALGLPIGLGIGLAIGNALDQKAKKEGRVI